MSISNLLLGEGRGKEKGNEPMMSSGIVEDREGVGQEADKDGDFEEAVRDDQELDDSSVMSRFVTQPSNEPPSWLHVCPDPVCGPTTIDRVLRLRYNNYNPVFRDPGLARRRSNRRQRPLHSEDLSVQEVVNALIDGEIQDSTTTTHPQLGAREQTPEPSNRRGSLDSESSFFADAWEKGFIEGYRTNDKL